MSVFPRFAYPYALILLVLLVPLSIWLGVRIRSLSTPRKYTATVLRCIILICLIGALAGAELVRTNDRLAVFFLLDRSNSIPEGARVASLDAVREICDIYMTSNDEAGSASSSSRSTRVAVKGKPRAITMGVATIHGSGMNWLMSNR